MNKINTVSIYYDDKSTKYHDPNFGSLECGTRTNINITYFISKRYRIVYPKKKSIHFKFLKKLHQNNNLVKYLSKTSFDQNLLQKILRQKSKNITTRNCHGCTSATSDNKCELCGTEIKEVNFFKYAHIIDNRILDSDTTYITHNSYALIKNVINLVCSMVSDIYTKKTNHGFAIVRPPGHHASFNLSGGFCLVNNIAICAEYARFIGFKNIFIFDFDAHHGNGTQEIFYNRKDVYYCSMHTATAYPKTGLENEIGNEEGSGYNLNIIVQKNIDTDSYLEIFRSKVVPTIAKYCPDLILISAGFDGLATDPMAIMKLTPTCYGEIIETLVNFEVPIGMVLEGGYDTKELPKCYDICLKKLAGY